MLVCLTEKELKRIVEDEQLSNQEEYNERLKYYCEKYHLGPAEEGDEEEHKDEICDEESNLSEGNSEEESALSTIDSRIKELHEKLSAGDISKNYQRTLKKKLKKLEEEREEQLSILQARRKDTKKTPTPKVEQPATTQPKKEKKTVK